LTVSELRVAGSAVFAVSGLPATLRPGAAARVEVVFQPSAVGSHARQLKLIADAPGAPSADVDLRGHGVRGLANLSGDVVDFGDVVVNEVATQTFLLVNNDGHAVTSVTIEQPGGADATAFLCGRSGLARAARTASSSRRAQSTSASSPRAAGHPTRPRTR
jgi:hypothetical protein